MCVLKSNAKILQEILKKLQQQYERNILNESKKQIVQLLLKYLPINSKLRLRLYT